MKACFLSYFTCWWLNYPSEKYAQVKMGENLPQMFGGENKKYLKPPPSLSSLELESEN